MYVSTDEDRRKNRKYFKEYYDVPRYDRFFTSGCRIHSIFLKSKICVDVFNGRNGKPDRLKTEAGTEFIFPQSSAFGSSEREMWSEFCKDPGDDCFYLISYNPSCISLRWTKYDDNTVIYFSLPPFRV